MVFGQQWVPITPITLMTFQPARQWLEFPNNLAVAAPTVQTLRRN
jgi:hypothetical protein